MLGELGRFAAALQPIAAASQPRHGRLRRAEDGAQPPVEQLPEICDPAYRFDQHAVNLRILVLKFGSHHGFVLRNRRSSKHASEQVGGN